MFSLGRELLFLNNTTEGAATPSASSDNSAMFESEFSLRRYVRMAWIWLKKGGVVDKLASRD